MNDSCPALAEDPEFGGEVILPSRMLDGGNMVIADIQKCRHIELHIQNPIVLESLGGYLHGHIVKTRFPGVGKMFLQFNGLGGRHAGGMASLSVLRQDRGYQSRGPAAPALLINIENSLEEKGRRRFALGSRDADQTEGLPGSVIAEAGAVGHGSAHIADPNPWQVDPFIGLLAQIEGGPSLFGHPQKVLPKSGSLADKECARNDFSGVTGDQGDFPLQALSQAFAKRFHGLTQQTVARKHLQIIG